MSDKEIVEIRRIICSCHGFCTNCQFYPFRSLDKGICRSQLPTTILTNEDMEHILIRSLGRLQRSPLKYEMILDILKNTSTIK